MRTISPEVITGAVTSVGVATSGPCYCRRTSTGLYEMYVPPGKKVVAIAAMVIQPAPQWSLLQAELTVYGFRVVIANTAGSANVDAGFFYTATLAPQ